MHLIMHLMTGTGKAIESDWLNIIEDVPCLIIWGANDNWISRKEDAEKFLRDLPNAVRNYT